MHCVRPNEAGEAAAGEAYPPAGSHSGLSSSAHRAVEEQGALQHWGAGPDALTHGP